MRNKHEEKLKQELKAYNEQTNIHELPEIFHYWSNKHLKPMHEEYGISHPDDLFSTYMFDSALSCNVDRPIFISIGSGNCDTEVRVAKLLKERGLQGFCIIWCFLHSHPWQIFVTSHQTPKLGTLWGRTVARIDYQSKKTLSIDRMMFKDVLRILVRWPVMMIRALFFTPKPDRSAGPV